MYSESDISSSRNGGTITGLSQVCKVLLIFTAGKLYEWYKRRLREHRLDSLQHKKSFIIWLRLHALTVVRLIKSCKENKKITACHVTLIKDYDMAIQMLWQILYSPLWEQMTVIIK